MKKRLISLAALLSMAAAWANDPSEKNVPTSPLTIYSGGFGVGAFRSMSDELKENHKQFLKVSFVNTVFFKERIGVFIDADWLLPGPNLGADIGFDFQPATGDFRPFIGAGIGAHYFDKDKPHDKFGDNIGPSATVHVGVTIDLSKSVQMRVRAPYHVVANDTKDQVAGIDIGFLFSNRYRHVRKLDYN